MINRKPKPNVDIFKYLSILIIFTFILFSPIFVQKFIPIYKINCTTSRSSCPPEHISDLNTLLPGNLHDTKIKIQKKLESDLTVSDYLIQYQVPDSIKVDVVFKTPKYAIKTNDGSYYLVDKNGSVVKKSSETGLPFLSADEKTNFEIGNGVSKNYYTALQIIQKVAWLYSIDKTLINENELDVYLKDGLLVRFSLDLDVDVSVGSLRLVFSRLNDESRGIKMSDIKEIDLRFKNAILR